jgi:hypothetical protein
MELMGKANRRSQANYYEAWSKSKGKKYEPTEEDLKCEMQLGAIGSFEPLMWKFDINQFKREIEPWNNSWVPYLQREGWSNNREGLCLVGLEGDNPNDSLSMPEAVFRAKRKLKETDFNAPTALYNDLPVLHDMLDYFSPLGRTMLIKSNAGGWFPPHRDNPSLTRETFRIVAFLSDNTTHESYEWEMEGRKMNIVPGRAYYVDTRKTHRTSSWMDNSIHLIVNVPKTWENVLKLISSTENY